MADFAIENNIRKSMSPGLAKRITVDSENNYCIRDTGIPVRSVVHLLSMGNTAANIVDYFPALELEDVQACFEWSREGLLQLSEEPEPTPGDNSEAQALSEIEKWNKAHQYIREGKLPDEATCQALYLGREDPAKVEVTHLPHPDDLTTELGKLAVEACPICSQTRATGPGSPDRPQVVVPSAVPVAWPVQWPLGEPEGAEVKTPQSHPDPGWESLSAGKELHTQVDNPSVILDNSINQALAQLDFLGAWTLNSAQREEARNILRNLINEALEYWERTHPNDLQRVLDAAVHDAIQKERERLLGIVSRLIFDAGKSGE